MMSQHLCHVNVPPLLHLPLFKEWVIILRNWTICVGHALSDIIKAPPIYDEIEVDGGTFLGCNGILKKIVPDRVANLARHDDTTTNHAEVLTEDH